jgi:1-acyl-sn-glycerol-3-phosphate acyltransferase
MSLASVVNDLVYVPTFWSAFYGFTFGFSFRATGREHLPKTGPVLIVANHQSVMDPVLVACAARRRLTFLARSTLFTNKFFGGLIRYYWAVPIDRGFGKEGLMTVLNELDQGRAVLMFVEGERTHDGELQQLKPGISLLIKRVKCPIVPAAVAGAYDAWPRHQKLPAFDPLLTSCTGRSISVAYRPPIDPQRYKGMEREAMLIDLFQEIALAKADAEKIRRKPGH